MLTTIHSRSFRATDLSLLVREETAWMERYFVELLRARWTFERDRGEVVARCELHAPSGYFVGEGRAIDLTTAAALATDKAVRWQRRNKRISRRRRHDEPRGLNALRH